MLFGFTLISASATEHTIYQGTCLVYNEFLKSLDSQTYQFRYDDKNKIFYFVTNDFITTGWINLTKDNLAQLRRNFEKYFEWEKTAVQNNVTLNRELPESGFTQQVTWKFGGDWFYSKNLTLKFKFFSQNEKRHQLVLQTNKAPSTSNQFITYQIEGYYFDKVQAQAFYNAITAENISKELEKIAQKNQVTDSLFN